MELSPYRRDCLPPSYTLIQMLRVNISILKSVLFQLSWIALCFDPTALFFWIYEEIIRQLLATNTIHGTWSLFGNDTSICIDVRDQNCLTRFFAIAIKRLFPSSVDFTKHLFTLEKQIVYKHEINKYTRKFLNISYSFGSEIGLRCTQWNFSAEETDACQKTHLYLVWVQEFLRFINAIWPK